MVSAPQKPSEFPAAAGGPGARRRNEPDVFGSRFLKPFRAEAQRLGFDACRIARPNALPDAPAQLAAFLGEGRHGDMDWLAERADWRADPRKLWPEVRSIVMLGMNYGPEAHPLAPPPK